MSTRPVLVTGSHRSGSTWVGRMLASAAGLHYVQEPFNIVDRLHWLERQPPHQFLYVDEHIEDEWVPAMQRVVDLRYPVIAHLRAQRPVAPLRRAARVAVDARRAARRGDAALLKDPIAIFSTEWLMRRFDVRPVVLVRDPVAFVGSLKERGWTFDFRHWLDQPQLMRDHLGDFEEPMRHSIERDDGIVDQGIIQWNAFYSFVDGFRRRHPDVPVLPYETLASNPLVEVKGLFRRLGLEFGPPQRATVERLTSAPTTPSDSPIAVERDSRDAMSTWRARLDADEVARIRHGTAAVAARFE